MSKDVKVIFITDPDFPRNKEFLELAAFVSDATFLDFYTMDVEELSFIAKHRILPAYTILFMHGQKVIGRLVNKFPKKKAWHKILKDIEK